MDKVVSAFSGTSLQRMILDGFNDGLNEVQDVMTTIASTIPTVGTFLAVMSSMNCWKSNLVCSH